MWIFRDALLLYLFPTYDMGIVISKPLSPTPGLRRICVARPALSRFRFQLRVVNERTGLVIFTLSLEVRISLLI
jgi:hypothetical protein